ncbi:MAG: hypothetical protein PHD58_03140, partial [Anaerolineales bacterium]|nr:hypothetical protein [Anaerolineales bacterium]
MTSLTLSQRDRTILAIVVGIAGLLCIALLPFVVVRAMDAVLKGAAIKIPASGNPLIATAPRIVLAFFPVWGGLSVAAGAALLLVSRAIQRGESWARPAAIGLLAVPSITGAYFSGPVMFFGKNAAPLFVLIALIGLVPYFVVLLWGKAPAGEKLGAFFLFLMLGVSAAWSFSNGGSSLRMFWARPEPYMLDSGNYGFLMGIPVVWIGVIATVISIPLLAAHTRQGWRLAMVGIANILIGNSILFVTHLKTKEFLIGMIMGVVTLILLSIPAIGGRLGKVEEAAQG